MRSVEWLPPSAMAWCAGKQSAGAVVVRADAARQENDRSNCANVDHLGPAQASCRNVLDGRTDDIFQAWCSNMARKGLLGGPAP